jgi:hypothetical protein
MFQLNGTALPSLALENFLEVENLKLGGSDRDEAEKMIAGALGSIYAGQYLISCLDHVEIVFYNSCVRYRKWTINTFRLIHALESKHHHLPDCFCPDVVIRGDITLP